MKYVLSLLVLIIICVLGHFTYERQECLNYMTYEAFFQMVSKVNGLDADTNFQIVHPISEKRAKTCIALLQHYSWFFSDPILLNRNN